MLRAEGPDKKQFPEICRTIGMIQTKYLLRNQPASKFPRSAGSENTRKVPFLKGFRGYPHGLGFPQMNTKKKFEICLTYQGILIVSPDVGTGL